MVVSFGFRRDNGTETIGRLMVSPWKLIFFSYFASAAKSTILLLGAERESENPEEITDFAGALSYFSYLHSQYLRYK